jgi:peptidoglycan/xylan/chitin deacetylase (PgdA/CDA1 family)
MSNYLLDYNLVLKIKSYLRKVYIFKFISYLVSIISYPWKGSGAILMYHRVLPDELLKEDLNIGMAVTTSEFEKQIKILKSKYKIVSIDEFNKNIKNKKSNFMVVITFDDGYKDNLIYALPILEKYQIPATIYITTRFLDNDTWMWWYELKKEILKKSELNFKFKNFKYNFILKNYKEKKVTFEKIRKLFLSLKIDEQIKLMELITGTKERKSYSDICLSKEDLIVLDKNPLITIGSHSHTHLNLSILDKENLLYEINKASEKLENLLNHKIKHFSYPYGQKEQVSVRESNLLADLNFNTAVTTQVFPLRNCSSFLLPRIYVGTNTCDKTLINHLSGFYNLASKVF